MRVIEFEILLNFLVAIGLGALVGLEREMTLQRYRLKDFGGFRTFILISFFGALTGFLGMTIFDSVAFVIAISISFFILAIAGYLVTGVHFKRIGATTEITSVITFFLGVLCSVEMTRFAVMFTVFVVSVLALKPALHLFAKKIEKTELFATVKFVLISLVVLPFLPNTDYTPLDFPALSELLSALGVDHSLLLQLDVFNLYNIWLMVVFIAGIGYLGYILIRLCGARIGLGLTGFLGGLVSSTAVSFNLSNESHKKKRLHNFMLSAILIASSTMFLRVLFIVLVLFPSLVGPLFVPLGLMAAVGYGSAYYLSHKNLKKSYDFRLSSPFALGPAIKFALFYALVLVISKLGVIIYGTVGVYVVSSLSGIADLNAITLSIISLVKHLEISSAVAVTAITFAVMVNTGVKVAIAYLFGDRNFAELTLRYFGLVIVAGFVGIMIL